MISINAITDAVESAVVEFDWKKYEDLANRFYDEAKAKGAEVAEAVGKHQDKLIRLLEKMAKGETSMTSAKRALGSYRRSIRNYLEGLAEWANWEKYEAFEEATEDAITFLKLIGSAVVKAIVL